MNLKGLKIKMNIKTCCLFEELTGKSFFECISNDDAIIFMYCCLIANNDITITLDDFKAMIQNKDISKWLEDEYRQLTDFNSQFNKPITFGEGKGDKQGKPLKMTDIASSLIIQHGVNPYYVNNDMGLYEINHLLETADNLKKAEALDKRFWTYIAVSPHINTNKVRKPEDLIKFEWEKETRKKQAEEDLINNEKIIKRLIGKQLNISNKQKEDSNDK